uniref:DNA-directed RNA polymerases I, II, and III subunit RPABC3 n=1 Tax=Chromera velia CCMP2878 TaxID=1169474 RepID=A0A0G4HZ78_9ALVE|mmetsp:Transcript_1971/g.4147  ORF Transcript_1971/g.4147 Transcript_1971/m.4147 type:complete len:141 (+) Transcript_1971:272-694(+)|eukprot:Cvel_9667.t1-p1 / transcript=Cvel_9667.t1 / gene=Cvel_9667 / organism=Chromera_velia_CCMP2878 / gene_product=DNA-directed RNA polymerases I, II, and III subunit, putative / transcript_product=DNA-directed RNA polymerases I, II, and III subunit, putative / location=Cvel_scaffold563:28215-30072(-) / protein_length=140 / sequence_SO=supercontig / SO=protein_coding / is_pseudo=false
MASTSLFEDTFSTDAINDEVFQNVARLTCHSVAYETELVLDINSQLFPVSKSDQLIIKLASSIKDKSGTDHNVLKKWDYCMYGKVFRIDEENQKKVTVYASFGGLMMSLKGQPRYLNSIQNNKRLYILMKKQGSDETMHF